MAKKVPSIAKNMEQLEVTTFFFGIQSGTAILENVLSTCYNVKRTLTL